MVFDEKEFHAKAREETTPEGVTYWWHFELLGREEPKLEEGLSRPRDSQEKRLRECVFRERDYSGHECRIYGREGWGHFGWGWGGYCPDGYYGNGVEMAWVRGDAKIFRLSVWTYLPASGGEEALHDLGRRVILPILKAEAHKKSPPHEPSPTEELEEWKEQAEATGSWFLPTGQSETPTAPERKPATVAAEPETGNRDVSGGVQLNPPQQEGRVGPAKTPPRCPKCGTSLEGPGWAYANCEVCRVSELVRPYSDSTGIEVSM